MSPADAPTESRTPARVAVLNAEKLEDALADDARMLPSRFRDLDTLLDQAREIPPRLCLLGPGLSPEEMRERVASLRRHLPFTDVVVWHPRAPAEVVRAALLSGARDVLLDPDPARAVVRLRDLLEGQRLLPLVLAEEDRSGGRWRFEGLVSRNREMWSIFETVARTASTDATILILGETGTGKDLVARAIHARSGRPGRFVALNCGAIPETLIDSELFGHVEGAFTGAKGSKRGLIRHAEAGTLFLDEIGNLPQDAQSRLLRVLQNGVVRPVGGEEEHPVDARVIAATSSPLDTAVMDGTFREDLLYRIDVIRLIIPPLRERLEDLIFLFGMFLQELTEQYNCARPKLGDDFLDALQAYEWPGNVRELENFTERLVLAHSGSRVTRTHFRKLTRTYRGRQNDGISDEDDRDASPRVAAAFDPDRTLDEVTSEIVSETERAYLEGLLAHTSGRVGAAAEQAGISRRTLHRKLSRHGIDKRRFRG